MTQKMKLQELERYGFGPNVMRRTKLCPACGTLVTDGAAQCPKCQKELPELTLFAWYAGQHSVCARCKTILSGDSRYCPQCGKRVEK